MTPTDTYLGLRAFADELWRCGLRSVCTSPGSRSTPLVLTFARDRRIHTTSHLDERSSGFFALGVGKATRIPAAVVCTSGTAAANFLPAVIEAHEARTPLLVLTADRPPELRALGAGQTIDQVKLYGDAVKWYLEVDECEATPARLRWLRQLACRIFWTSVTGRPGPVHINFSLREPLILDAPLPAEEPGELGDRKDRAPLVTVHFERILGKRLESSAEVDSYLGEDRMPEDMKAYRGSAQIGSAANRYQESPQIERIRSFLDRSSRPVLVAGRNERDIALHDLVASLAEEYGIPLLADPLSGARQGEFAVAHYDALLRNKAWADRHVPDLVIRIGDLPTSKPLRFWLHSPALTQTTQITIDAEASWQDPAGVVSHIFAIDPTTAISSLLQTEHTSSSVTQNWQERSVPPARSEFLTQWLSANSTAERVIKQILHEDEEINEPWVAKALGDELPEESTLFVASSMPIRDVETFFSARSDAPRVLSNRGANGIDGTIATALGVAASSPDPVVLFIGDVAFAYDLTSLLTASHLGLNLVVVLVNNDGGGIFHFLPVADEGQDFVDYVLTPRDLRFEELASFYGFTYHHIEAKDGFRSCLGDALQNRGITVIEVKTDSQENVKLHRRVWSELDSALSVSTV